MLRRVWTSAKTSRRFDVGTFTRVLARHRGKRNHTDLLPLTVGQIKAWNLALHERTGSWPTQVSGPIPEVDGETWRGIDQSLERGRRGLPGGMSLATLKREISPVPQQKCVDRVTANMLSSKTI